MATHSSVLAWRIPGMGEPGGLPSMGSRTRLKQLSSSSSSMVTFRLMNKIWVRTVRMQLRLGQLRENDAVFGTGCVGISCLCITMSSLVQVSITYQILFVLSSQCM